MVSVLSYLLIITVFPPRFCSSVLRFSFVLSRFCSQIPISISRRSLAPSIVKSYPYDFLCRRFEKLPKAREEAEDKVSDDDEGFPENRAEDVNSG